MLDPLIASRAVHFASSLVVAGVAIFSAFVAYSVRLTSLAKRRQQKLMLGALALAVLSGATWLLFLASRIAQTSVAEAIGDGTAWSVLTETQFGRVWEARLLVAILLGCVGLIASGAQTRGLRLPSLQAALAVLFVAMLAWSGHAAGTLGFGGLLHFSGDVFHLVTGAAWVGGLVPLLVFLGPRVRGSQRAVRRRGKSGSRRIAFLPLLAHHHRGRLKNLRPVRIPAPLRLDSRSESNHWLLSWESAPMLNVLSGRRRESSRDID